MHSENETKRRGSLDKKVSLLLFLWILDKVVMLIMLLLIG
jgi:hypothetical protein